MIAIGIDPGAETGYVIVEVPTDWASTAFRFDLNRIAIVGAGIVTRPTPCKSRSPDDADEEFFTLLREAFSREAEYDHELPELAVLEEPLDARAMWAGDVAKLGGYAPRKPKTNETPATKFRQGVYFGLAKAACYAIEAATFSYPVLGVKGRAGWQRILSPRPRHQIIAQRMAALYKARDQQVYGPDDVQEPADHVLMALGVLVAHFTARSRKVGLV